MTGKLTGMAKDITLPSTTRTSEEELLAMLTRPSTRGTSGAGRQRSSHGYKVFKAFLEAGDAIRNLEYANEDDAKAARLSLTKEADLLNAERENPLEQLWVSPREGRFIKIADLGKVNSAEAKAQIIMQQKSQQHGVMARMAGKYDKNHQGVKDANAKVNELDSALKALGF